MINNKELGYYFLNIFFAGTAAAGKSGEIFMHDALWRVK